MSAILHKWIDEQSLAYVEDKMERIIVPDVGKGKDGTLNGLNAVFYLNRETDRMVVEVVQPNRLISDRGVGADYCCSWNREKTTGDVLFTDKEGTHLVWRRILPCEYSAEEVKPLLDKYYSRCLPNAIRKMYESDDERKDGSFWKNHFTSDKSGKILAGSEESHDELTAWRIAGNICLIHSADDSGRMKIRMYTFVLFDGESRRTIAEFDYLPDPDAMNAILSVWTVPDAVNNVAAMYYNDKAWTHSVDDDYVVRLLSIAAQFGSATACENFARLGRDRRWSKARIERWLYFAEACRDTVEAGHAPKMGLKSISDWPMSWVGD